MTRKITITFILALLVLSIVPFVSAQDAIESVCLVTDIGRVNDGGFNQSAFDGMNRAATDFNLESTFIETQAITDYADNINSCVDEGFDIIVTVGFLIQDATVQAAAANPELYFLGVDQDPSFLENAPANYVGIQFREDQAGFLVGSLAALVAGDMDSNIIAGVYGIDVPAVVRFRNGYEQGARFINPDIEVKGVYIPDFLAPDRGASAAQQFIGEGATVIFGAGGPTGTGAITEAAKEGVYVIGVDKDEYFTNFQTGEAEGAEFIISSALKRVDQGVYDMIAALAGGMMENFPGGAAYLMDASINGVGFSCRHDAAVGVPCDDDGQLDFSDEDDPIVAKMNEILEGLLSGEIETGVDPVSGQLLEPAATEESN